MATPVIAPTPPREQPQTDSRQSVSHDRVTNKRADAVSAKKKKKRAAHRVTLRRSHTKG